MSTITFDTLKFVERLEKAGASRELATALAEAQKESLAEALDSTLATKMDIAHLDTKIELLRAENTHTRWMLGIVIALSIANFAKQFF